MTDFRRITINAGWNLLGNVLPLGAAALAIPFLLSRMGAERFGLLSLAWVLLGYFSLFDMGLGRALTKMVAERAPEGDDNHLSTVCSTGIALVTALGLAGTLFVAIGVQWAAAWINTLPEALLSEATSTLLLIALGIPFVVVAAALQGILEGFQRFRRLNAVRIPAGIALFAAPCVAVIHSPRLDVAVAALLLTRIAVVGAYVVECRRLVWLRLASIQREWIGPMLRFGGWLTVSNIVGPVIVYADRFIVGAVMSAAVLAYYTVPSEVISRMLLVPVALTGALFPALSQTQGQNLESARGLRRRSVQLTVAVVIPVACLVALLAQPALRLWLGAEFSAQSTRVLQILLLGFICNALAQVPFASLQSYGQTRQTAFLHLVELPIYLGIFVVLVQERQLEGAAIAWSLRACIDWIALSLLLRTWERRRYAASLKAMKNAESHHDH